MSVGLDALRIFKAKGSVEMRKKYPTIYREDIDKSCHFNPNNDYLYAPSSEEIIKHTSPWYCFALIPDTTNEGKSSLNASLYLMQFLNWAIYYYNRLIEDYKSIPKHPKQEVFYKTQEETKFYAEMIEAMTGEQLSQEEMDTKTSNAFKKNHFPLKPSDFLKLCRFFSRAWYEQRFSSEKSAVGSVEFAHYVSCYIENNPSQINDPKCSYYNGNNDNAKKEVARLFPKSGQGEEKEKRTSKHTYRYNDFDIEIERYDSSKSIEYSSNTYTISIIQRCRHSFYLSASLYQHRYNSSKNR